MGLKLCRTLSLLSDLLNSLLKIMAPMKAMKEKAMKAASSSKALTKGALIKDIAAANELKTKEVSQIFDSLAAIATKEVKKTGVFTVPGLCRIKTKTKPATKQAPG